MIVWKLHQQKHPASCMMLPEMLNVSSHNEHFQEHNKQRSHSTVLLTYSGSQQFTQLSENLELLEEFLGFRLQIVGRRVFSQLKGKNCLLVWATRIGKREEGEGRESAKGSMAVSRCKTVHNTWGHSAHWRTQKNAGCVDWQTAATSGPVSHRGGARLSRTL